VLSVIIIDYNNNMITSGVVDTKVRIRSYNFLTDGCKFLILLLKVLQIGYF